MIKVWRSVSDDDDDLFSWGKRQVDSCLFDVSEKRRKMLGADEVQLNTKDLKDTARARDRVLVLLSDLQKHTVDEIVEVSGGQREALRRVRELRRPPYNLDVKAEHAGGRQWTYRLVSLAPIH